MVSLNLPFYVPSCKPPAPRDSFPRQEYLSFEHGSIHDDFQDVKDPIPQAVASNGGAIGGAYQAVTDGNPGSQSAERGGSDIWQNGARRIRNSKYTDSSDTIGDEETQDLKTHYDTPLAQNSTPSIEDTDKQSRGSTYTDLADRPSTDSCRDLEKGETRPRKHDQVNQEGEDNEQNKWENNVVGWDGPNDPQNPQNWKKSKKYTVTIFYATLTFCITFSSSVFSTATMATAKIYGVSNEVMTLGTSLVVLVSVHSPASSSSTDTSTGFRRGPTNMGSPLRALRSKDPSILRFHRLRHLPDPRRRSPEHPNNHARSILRRCLWIRTTSHDRRDYSGLLGSCRTRLRPWPLCRRNVHWTRGRTYRGWFHHAAIWDGDGPPGSH